jgi:hypothetical protein
LSEKPLGTFIVRPHDTSTDQFFVSFVSSGVPKDTSAQQEVVKHAIIRRERILNLDDRTECLYVYSCGKIGPSDSLIGILR